MMPTAILSTTSYTTSQRVPKYGQDGLKRRRDIETEQGTRWVSNFRSAGGKQGTLVIYTQVSLVCQALTRPAHDKLQLL